MGPISVSVREVTPTTSPGNPGPGLLTTATVAAPTPPAEPTTTTTTPSPSSGHHSHFQGNDLPSISKKKKTKSPLSTTRVSSRLSATVLPSDRSSSSRGDGVYFRIDIRPSVAAILLALQSSLPHAAIRAGARVARSRAQDGAATVAEARSGKGRGDEEGSGR